MLETVDLDATISDGMLRVEMRMTVFSVNLSLTFFSHRYCYNVGIWDRMTREEGGW